ncbi:MAG TPA: ribonuclease P protein component [Usitatibacter sp.]|nr:ribonuclease P protein component [Usitatibacter sp.]
MSRGVRREGLSRRHRFRGRDSFRPLLRSPRKFTGTLAILHVAPAVTAAGRFGLSVGRRAAKLSVDRNYIKRRAREAFRRHAVKSSPVDVVLTLTSRFRPELVEDLVRELGELMDRVRARAAG